VKKTGREAQKAESWKGGFVCVCVCARKSQRGMQAQRSLLAPKQRSRS